MDISELPEVQQIFSRWPWREWDKLPAGKMMDITDICNGISGDLNRAGQTLRNKAMMRGLKVAKRNDRLFIMRPAQSDIDRRVRPAAEVPLHQQA